MEELKKSLTLLLADTYTIFIMTQNYHWNVKGKNFYELHKLFQAQYEDMFEAIDEIAERISGLGEIVPGSFSEFSSISEIGSKSPTTDPDVMLENLQSAHRALIQNIEKGLDIAGEQGDEDTFDLMVQRLKAHNKMNWMLKQSSN